MTDGTDDGPRSKGPILAIGAAFLALATSIGAVVVLVVRDRGPAVAATDSEDMGRGSAGSAARVPSTGVTEVAISASDVLKLKQRELLDDATGGVVVTDDTLRSALKLGPDDVIAAIGGRTVTRELDIYDAMMGLTMAETTAVYVDVVRGGTPVLLRWKLDVSMRSAWRASLTLGSTSPSSPFGSVPSPAVDPDPALVAKIVKIDDLEYEAPRAALDALFGFTVRGARAVPSMRSGVPNGVKLYAIRPTSLYAAIGITNGDSIQSLNGQATPDVDQLIEVYGKVKSAARLTIGIERRGRPIELSVAVK